jgi:hypothetical protein
MNCLGDLYRVIVFSWVDFCRFFEKKISMFWPGGFDESTPRRFHAISPSGYPGNRDKPGNNSGALQSCDLNAR